MFFKKCKKKIKKNWPFLRIAHNGLNMTAFLRITVVHKTPESVLAFLLT